MHDGRQHHFVGLDEEPRGLHANDEVLAGHHVGLALAHAGALAHAPDLDPPGGQVLGHVERNLGRAVFRGRQSADPQGRVGELGANGRLDHRSRRRSPADAVSSPFAAIAQATPSFAAIGVGAAQASPPWLRALPL